MKKCINCSNQAINQNKGIDLGYSGLCINCYDNKYLERCDNCGDNFYDTADIGICTFCINNNSRRI